MPRRILPGLFFAILLALAVPGRGEAILVQLTDVPADGFVVASVDLTSAVRQCHATPLRPEALRAVSVAQGEPLPSQFVPDADFEPSGHVAGTLIVRLPKGGDTQVRLEIAEPAAAPSAAWDGSVTTPSYTIRHDAKRLGGLPSRITIANKAYENFFWQDRLYEPKVGTFALGDAPQAVVVQVAEGPLCTVVRTMGRYVRGDGTSPESQPSAVYQWFYFHDRPLVYVTAVQRQAKPFAWAEAHFLQLQLSGKDFPAWIGGNPSRRGDFGATEQHQNFTQWAALVDGPRAIGALQSGRILVYDSGQGKGSYLHAQADVGWSAWSDTERRLHGWLWIGSVDEPGAALAAAASKIPSVHAHATVDTIQQQLTAAQQEFQRLPKEERQKSWWRVAGAQCLEATGQFETAVGVSKGILPLGWTARNAGELGMLLEQQSDGIRLLGLWDTATGQALSAAKMLPLFGVTLRRSGSEEQRTLDANQGWSQVSVQSPSPEILELQWRRPQDGALGDLAVQARATLDATAGAIRWTLQVDNPSDAWSVWRVAFPQLALAERGSDGEVFFPRGAGEVQRGLWRRAFHYKDGYPYPGGWTTMQFLAAYDRQRSTGLYLAAHDPYGSIKDISVRSLPDDRVVQFLISSPAEQIGVAGNDFALNGQAVWQLLRGDWFDAARIYRDWVRAEAKWYPTLGPNGREDTPQWLRDLPAWALEWSGDRKWEDCIAELRAFQQFLGVPIGVHWYGWHGNPFDNDYPQYFPTHPGFAEVVRELQKDPIHIMPYINGRLWDTRDRGLEDFEFTKIALPAATKDEHGQPIKESYGSKESDGSPVSLAVMCPTTPLWQERLKATVLRIMNECGTHGVYLDQIAAAGPVLCFDPSHGHPLGGGRWWTEGYWKLMEAIRQAKPQDRILTSECNAEPFLRWFDGYLTWHWQYDGQVPAFPAIYGGAIQMFGRCYRGGPTKDLALRMKAGQQLVFGEQIGWLGPEVVKEPENAAFLREAVRLRWALRRYFSAGEMARPPQLAGEIPRVTADWQWSGEWPVTTDAVLTGAWRLPAEEKLVLLLVNVSDQAMKTRLPLDWQQYGLPAAAVQVRKVTAEGAGEPSSLVAGTEYPIELPARTPCAWEITLP